MVQPFQASVDELGETALVFIDGEFSHSLRKRSVLQPDEVAPVRTTDLMVAEAMYDPELVLTGTYEADELELARAHRRSHHRALRLRAALRPRRHAARRRRPPLLLELEAVEPNLYFDQFPEGAGLARHLRRAGERALLLGARLSSAQDERILRVPAHADGHPRLPAVVG